MPTTTQPTDLAKILDKIARLKGLAERPGTPEEAAAALAAIQRLMLKHNLDMAQVDLAGRTDQRGFEKESFNLGAAMNWRRNLINALCKYTFCDAVFPPRGSGVFLIGERHNIEVVKGMYEYLVNEVMRLADLGWSQVSPEERMFARPRAWKNAFRLGAGTTLGNRLKEQFEEQKAAEDQSAVNALVLVKDNALAEAVAEFFPNLKTSRSKASMSDGRGYQAGLIAGSTVNLAAQIEA
jgi:hypothetical protein